MLGVSRWFIDNPIASKILMLFILLSGLVSFPMLPKIFFPQVEINVIKVSVVYPGAGPAEVEKQVTQRIEESIDSLSGFDEIKSISREGYAEVLIKLDVGQDSQRSLNDVRAKVDAITSFPASAERPQIVEQRMRVDYMRLLLTGDVSERELKVLGEQIREEIAALPAVDIAELEATRDYEVSVEISEQSLIEHGISFDQVANAIRSYSFEQPVGKIRDAGGDVQLQTRVQADSAVDFESIPVLRKRDGSVIRVGDLAEVIDGFVDTNRYSRVNGESSVSITVINESSGDILATTGSVRAYVESKNLQLPGAVQLTIVSDMSVPYQGRMDTLIKNGSSGLILVFLLLMMFLRPVLAFWVCMGIAVAFLGAVWGLSLTSLSLNVLSMFAFILILGIVVDDAIVIGEAVHTRQLETGNARQGAIEGVQSMMTPVAFAVISTMIFFVPFYFLSDHIPSENIATPVMLALAFSLIESFFLLPAHLAHQRSRLPQAATANSIKVAVSSFFAPLKPLFSVARQRFDHFQGIVSESLPRFARTHYRRWLLRSVSNKSITILLFLIMFACSVALLRGGWIPFHFFPKVTADFMLANATLPESSAYSQTFELVKRIEQSAEQLREQINGKYERTIITNVYAYAAGNTVFVMIALEDDSNLPVSTEALADQWRKEIGAVHGVTDMNVQFTLFETPSALAFELRGDSLQELQAFSAALTADLGGTPGVFDVQSSLEHPSSEINFKLNPEAESLAISMQDVSSQIRQAFYGEEVQRIPRSREDVKVFVRYPREQRSFEEALTNMKIVSVDGDRVPLSSVVSMNYRESYKKIERVDGRRVASITASIHPGFSAADITDDIVRRMQADSGGDLAVRFPGIQLSVAGEEEDRREFVGALAVYMLLAMVAIFGLMAVVFHSYWQPLLVLTAIPFGFMGGVVGHLIIGSQMSMMSLLGMLACAGVVVNDNVVLIDRINQLRALGQSARVAVVNAGIQRFRPIVLTSLTTFLGLTPILLETSVQAQFLVPMVASLAFGVVFATAITLVFVPCLYLSMDNLMLRLGVSRGNIAHARQSIDRHSESGEVI